MSPRTLVLVVWVGTAVGLGYTGYPENGFLPPAAIAAEQGKILYYRNPMGSPDTSPTPKKDSMGMDYIPVYEGEAAPSAPATAPKRILYYRNPMGSPDTSPTPKKDSMGMDYIPVYEGEAAPSAPATAPKRILYYRNPMGLPDTSPTPKKDSMGMDYIPVYEGEDTGGDQVRISPEKVQKLGVRTEAAQRRVLSRPVRAVGLIAPDERRLFTVAPRFEGWIERLLVNSTGQTVKRGEPLMAVYSPELVSAQREYLLARGGLRALSESSPETREGMNQLAETALLRLRNWEISADQLERLRKEGQPQQQLLLRAPADGVVLEKTAIQGMRFMPGEMLYRIADLSSLWLVADVFEQDLNLVHPGQEARITVNAFPGELFLGKVAFIYPTLNPQTRTAQVRVELPNPKGRLRPAMYASIELAASHNKAAVLTIPTSAVLSSGARPVVLVELGEGRYQPREVRLGLRGDEYVQVLEGLADQEQVVVSANFLIDAESNLKAALGSFGGHSGHGATASSPATTPETPPAPVTPTPPASAHEGH